MASINPNAGACALSPAIFSLARIAIITFVITILVNGVVRIQAAPLGPVFDPYSNTNLYLVGSAGDSWTESQAAAQAIGGNLITIHSAAENQFVASMFFQNFTTIGGPNLASGPDAIALWFGLYDPTGAAHDDGPGGPGSQHAANFAWVNGENSTYRNWNIGEPNDSSFPNFPGEYYGILWGPNDGPPIASGAAVGAWNDLPNNFPAPQFNTGFYGVAEVSVPEPASISLMSLSVIAAMLRPKRRCIAV